MSHRISVEHVALLANRRRFDREGVALLLGDRDVHVRLPIVSRREIYVRPAWRGERRDRRLTIEERIFALLGWPIGVLAALAVIAVLVIQVVRYVR